MRPALLPLCLLLVTAVPATRAQSNAARPEQIAALADSSVSQPIRSQLEPNGYRVPTAEGPVDVWFRAGVPSGKNPEPGAIYDKLTESTLVGVVRFAKDSRDYKGERIPAGTYTLRYEIQPNDGNHLGTAPTRDFLLVLPADADTDPNATYALEKLVQLSSRVNGSNKHPTPLNLVAPESNSFPVYYKDDEDHTILAVQLKTASGLLPIALVVKGTAPQ
ncbi:MAG: hypothetical protein JO041_12835 [Acidobacteria bacterium]|nr:hypothetical protein [Acidobacteriota bacterium]